MYRDFATRKARGLGIVGEVENKPDGTVFVIGEGEEGTLQTFIELLQQGSLLSRVERVDVVWKEATGALNKFTLCY